jgi:type IV secretion system protein VirB1
MELAACPDLAVPYEVMRHIVNVESSHNPYAIGVVGGELERQPASLDEAAATARMLDEKGYNYSLGIAQVNRKNLARYGLTPLDKAFDACANLSAGSKILAECHSRAGGDWGKAFSCYYSGNFKTGFSDGYVQRVYASMGKEAPPVILTTPRRAVPVTRAEPVSRTATEPAAAPPSRTGEHHGMPLHRQSGDTAFVF